MNAESSAPTIIRWSEGDELRAALWRSEAGIAPPKRVQVADDTLTADAACALASQGCGLLWRGDYQNAKQLLQAMARRIDRIHRPPKKAKTPAKPAQSESPAEAFHLYRMARAQRARTLGMLLIPFDAGHVVALRRAPDVRHVCEEVYGAADAPYVTSLRELLGIIGAGEWRKRGVEVPALGAPGVRIHPHYGVFSPVRGEYLDLVASAPLPQALAGKAGGLAFDIGTGSGVLAALLARRGVARVVATDLDARALACARENMARLGLAARVEVVAADLFPPGRAPLVVCNPPWLPGKPGNRLERAVYDPESRMLRGFLAGLAAHLAKDGEGWLILSDLAEHLGLRSRDELPALFEAAGLRVLGKLDARATHRGVSDADDPFHFARAAEVTSLWRLGVGDE
jgi:SAM-dependent methyltransferase